MLDPKKWSNKSAKSTDLQENAAKALKMKDQSGPRTTIPDHCTSHEGGVQKGQIDSTDMAAGKEGTFVENLSRSRGARTSDTGKSTS